MKKIRFFWAFLLLSLPFVAFSQRGNVVFDSVAVNGTLNLDITRLQGTAIGVIGFDNTGKVVTTQATANVTNNNYGVANGVRVLTYERITDTAGIITIDLGVAQPLRGFTVLSTSAIVQYTSALLPDDQRQLAYATLVTQDYGTSRYLQYKVSTPVQAGVATPEIGRYPCPTNPQAQCTTTPISAVPGTLRKVIVTLIVTP